MQSVIDFLNGILWSTPFIIFCLGSGLVFTFMTRVVQVRKIKEMVSLLFNSHSSQQGLSSFQAFSLALSGRVGTGNVAGVATAIALGGPGSVFWMWVLATLGSATAFVESTLAQIYKREIDGEYRGGTAFIIKYGLKKPILGGIFAILIGGSSVFALSGIQANSIAASMKQAFGVSPMISGIVIVIPLAAIIFGGVKRLGRVAEMVIPAMAGFYLLFAGIIIAVNISEVPAMISLIVNSAFGAGPVFGGIVGAAITMGVKRGIYSNEAGLGTATQSSASAEVSHPAKQGLVQAFSVYIDTMLVCTATAFMIIITKSYNVMGPAGEYVVNHIGDVEMGPVYTQLAVDSVISWGSQFVAISLFFFAFTTLMYMYYNAETNLAYFFKDGLSKPALMFIRFLYLVFTFYGAINTVGAAWGFGDVGLGFTAWLNLLTLALLGRVALKTLKDYEDQTAQGLDPVFDPEKLGIEGASFWENKIRKTKA